MTLDLQMLLDTYKAVKAHDNEIMAHRPADCPRAAWRMENPHKIQTSWYVTGPTKRRLVARLNYDTKAVLEFWTDTPRQSRIVDSIDFNAADAEQRLSAYTLVWSMTGQEIERAKERLGEMWGLNRPLHNSELARFLRLSGRDMGATVQGWINETPRITGPASVAIQMALSGAVPPDPLDQILR